ncbi:MAG: hypothetical protein JRJ38_09440 [Deltaproteobacteria bacterium]|nr:hypothetical protein [Deltaproteobacteria bacterium]
MNTLFVNIVKAFFGKGRALWDVQEFPFFRQNEQARPGATEVGQCTGEAKPVWARDGQDK